MWSGDQGRRVGVALHDFLQCVVQGPDYFVSDEIDKGKVWDAVLTAQLETAQIGIACLSPDSLNSPWIHFEAGSISKASPHSQIIPYIVGLRETDVTGPLSRFQIAAANKADTWKLVTSINAAVSEPRRLREPVLRRAFEKQWDDLEEVLDQVQSEMLTEDTSMSRIVELQQREVAATLKGMIDDLLEARKERAAREQS